MIAFLREEPDGQRRHGLSRLLNPDSRIILKGCKLEASLSKLQPKIDINSNARVISVPKAKMAQPLGARLPSHHLTEGSLGKGSERLKTIPWMGITDALGMGLAWGVGHCPHRCFFNRVENRRTLSIQKSPASAVGNRSLERVT